MLLAATATVAFLADSGLAQTTTVPPKTTANLQPGDLPPGMRELLTALPSTAQAKIMSQLNAVNFQSSDAPYIRWDANYQILVVDEKFPLTGGAIDANPSGHSAPTGYQRSGVPIYHSRLGATYTLYLDFDGHKWSGHAWASGATIDAKAYSYDADNTTYSSYELDLIGDAWAVVAEDFAPFDIDVTTEQPASLTNNVGHVLMTDQVDRQGVNMYPCTCGGVAYVNVFKASNYASYYSPALVFNKGLVGVSEAISHEFGHNLGLSHDGTTGGVTYYQGHGEGETDWSTIMGLGYYASIVQWSKGEYLNANQLQDDLAIIAAKIGYSADDYNTFVPAPLDVFDTAQGIIERNNDVDSFTFTTTVADLVGIYVTPPPGNFGNLDVGFLLKSGATVLQTVEPPRSRSASWAGQLAAGTYIIDVYGTANPADPAVVGDQGYTRYASIGQYEVRVLKGVGVTLSRSPSPPPPPSPSVTPSATPSATRSATRSATPSRTPSRYRSSAVITSILVYS
eukprot:g44598.t1